MEPTGAESVLTCPRCAYDLRGIPALRCPECGFGYDQAAIPRIAGDYARVERIYWRRAAGLAGLIGAACLVRKLLPGIATWAAGSTGFAAVLTFVYQWQRGQPLNSALLLGLGAGLACLSLVNPVLTALVAGGALLYILSETPPPPLGLEHWERSLEAAAQSRLVRWRWTGRITIGLALVAALVTGC